MVNSSKSPSRSELKASNPFAPGKAAGAEDAKTIAATAAHPPASHLIRVRFKARQSSARAEPPCFVEKPYSESPAAAICVPASYDQKSS